MKRFTMTSEAVTPGHPDKLCDQISDAIVDACLSSGRPIGCVAECAIASGVVFLSVRHGGELQFDPASLARRVLEEAGYHGRAPDVPTTIMLDCVEAADLAGATGQATARIGQMATVFGYACDQNGSRMPWPIHLAHAIAARLDAVANGNAASWLARDGQVQTAIDFERRLANAVTGLAVSYFAKDRSLSDEAEAVILRRDVIDHVLAEMPLPAASDVRISIGRMPGPGGPAAHSGQTGRKTANDLYGGIARNGGSALSGKDPSRIERVGAYAARQAAVSVVAAGLAKECEVQLSYLDGETGHESLEIDSYGSGQVPDPDIARTLAEKIDFRRGAIAERLGLWRLPSERAGRFYREIALAGHVGRDDMELPWDAPVPLD